jgi:uncharacterized membrane protein
MGLKNSLVALRFLIASTLILAAASWPAPARGAELYKWKDADGKLHVTETPPPAHGRLQEIIEYDPAPPSRPPAAESAGVPETSPTAGETERRRRCRLVSEAREIAGRARSVHRSAKEDAERARQEAADLRDRVGFDDEELDDFKDDIRRLEEKARRAELRSQLAGIQADSAELQSKLIEALLEEDCREPRF